jgi:hypothetical protein
VGRGYAQAPVATLRALAQQCVNDATDIPLAPRPAPPGVREHWAVWPSFNGSGGPVLGSWAGFASGGAAGQKLYRQTNGQIMRITFWPDAAAASDLEVQAMVNGSPVVLTAGAVYKFGSPAATYSAGKHLGLRLSVVGDGTLGSPVNVAAIARLVE